MLEQPIPPLPSLLRRLDAVQPVLSIFIPEACVLLPAVAPIGGAGPSQAECLVVHARLASSNPEELARQLIKLKRGLDPVHASVSIVGRGWPCCKGGRPLPRQTGAGAACRTERAGRWCWKGSCVEGSVHEPFPHARTRLPLPAGSVHSPARRVGGDGGGAPRLTAGEGGPVFQHGAAGFGHCAVGTVQGVAGHGRALG